MKFVFFVMLLGALSLVSCARTGSQNQYDASRSEPLRVLLIKYYESKGHFPTDPNSLKELDPQLICQGGLWNGWNYTSWDPDEHDLWTYPSRRSRRSLWLKFNANDASKTGWFINDDNGAFQMQPIPLLPDEIRLLRESSG